LQGIIRRARLAITDGMREALVACTSGFCSAISSARIWNSL
jgi:hypothetical protein